MKNRQINEDRLKIYAGKSGSHIQIIEPRLSSLSILVSFPDGVAYEDEKEWGISHFLEHLHLQGTPEYPSLTAISSILEEEGGKTSAYSTRDSTNYWVTVPSEGAVTAIRLLSAILSNREFSPEKVESEKKIIFQEMERERANARFFHAVASEGLLLAPHPIGRYPPGIEAFIRDLTPQRILEYKVKACAAANCHVTAAGCHVDRLKEEIDSLLESLPGGDKRAPFSTPIACDEGSPRLFKYPGLSLVNMIVGWGTEKDLRRDWLPLKLLNTLLGVGFGSRLYKTLREEHRLTYLVTTQSRIYYPGATFRISLDIAPGDAGKALGLIRREIGKIREGDIEVEDLDRARSRLWGNTILSMEDTLECARFMNRLSLLGIEPLPLSAIRDGIYDIQAEDLSNLANAFLTDESLKVSLAGSSVALDVARSQSYKV